MKKSRGLYHTFLYSCVYIDYILVVKHPDDDQWSDRDVLVKNNNLRFSVFINVHFLFNPVSIV
jgi:hypothetical protein